MNTMSRLEVMAMYRKQIAEGKILLGVGAGTGITAKFSEKGGADMLIIYNSGRYRMAGRGSLAGLMAYGDANKIVVEMAAEVLPVVEHTPVLAGVNGTDPFRVMDVFLKELKAMRLLNGKALNVIELPMPADVIYEGQMLPASYANFYISNGHVIVPTYRCAQDDKAMQIIQSCFTDRKVVGIDSTDIIWGLGSFHCLSQQEPSI
ncbi:MAG: phosphoenolpyruvate hydrolase family protein [Erysipelotrichaceae bacterium]